MSRKSRDTTLNMLRHATCSHLSRCRSSPSGPAHGATVNPASRSYPTVPTTGESGNWSLDTAGMDPCGCTIQLQSNDRTWVDCVNPWRNDSAFVGFCLVAAP